MIKSGFMIQVRSWECDADHANTIIIDGLSKDLVTFYVRFLSLIHESELMNFYLRYKEYPQHTIDQLTDKVVKLAEEFPNVFTEMGWDTYGDLQIDSDVVLELAYELLGSSEHYYFRVYDMHTVYNIKEVIYPEVIQ